MRLQLHVDLANSYQLSTISYQLGILHFAPHRRLGINCRSDGVGAAASGDAAGTPDRDSGEPPPHAIVTPINTSRVGFTSITLLDT